MVVAMRVTASVGNILGTSRGIIVGCKTVCWTSTGF